MKVITITEPQYCPFNKGEICRHMSTKAFHCSGHIFPENCPLEEDAETSKLRLRKLLWLRHGCEVSALYGDDGEMQCSSCGIDFKRTCPEAIYDILAAKATELLSKLDQLYDKNL